MKYSREVKTALLAIVAIVILVFGYSFLMGKNLLTSDRTFYAVYSDVEGLSPSSEVTINGLRVGQVTKISFLEDGSGDLVVKFMVKNKFPFSKDSQALVYGGNIIGGKSLAIIPNYNSDLPLAEDGDTLVGNKEEGIMELVNDRLKPLQNKLENSIVSIDSMLTAVTEILNDSTRNNIRNTFRNLDQTVISFKSTASGLDKIVNGNSAKLDRTFTNLDEMSTNFNKFSDTLTNMNISKITSDLEGMIADFKGISEKLNSSEGTAGKLLNDDAVYENLNRATKQMEELVQDIKLNPKRYVSISVFGKKAGAYKEPEDSLK